MIFKKFVNQNFNIMKQLSLNTKLKQIQIQKI